VYYLYTVATSSLLTQYGVNAFISCVRSVVQQGKEIEYIFGYIRMFHHQNAQNGSEAHPLSYSMCTGILSRG